MEDGQEENSAIVSGSDDTPDEEAVSDDEIQDQYPIDSGNSHLVDQNQTGKTDNMHGNSVCGGCSSEESEQVILSIVGYDMPSDTWDDDLRPLTPADLARDNTPGFIGADWDREYGIIWSFRAGCL